MRTVLVCTAAVLIVTGASRAEDCGPRPEARSYLQDLSADVYERWAVPPEPSVSHARIRFELDSSGRLETSEVIEASTPEVGDAVLTVLREGSPYPALPTGAECLANESLVAAFRLESDEASSLWWWLWPLGVLLLGVRTLRGFAKLRRVGGGLLGPASPIS